MTYGPWRKYFRHEFDLVWNNVRHILSAFIESTHRDNLKYM